MPAAARRPAFNAVALLSAALVLLGVMCLQPSIAAEDRPVANALDKHSQQEASTASSAALEAWQVTRSKGPAGEPDSIAILRVADLARSDPGLAGLMLRCSKSGVEPVIVLIEPISPQAHPKITLRVDGQEAYFDGAPLPTGEGVRIFADGLALATGPWRNAGEMSIRISGAGDDIAGVVGLAGLSSAIASLASCAPN